MLPCQSYSKMKIDGPIALEKVLLSSSQSKFMTFFTI